MLKTALWVLAGLAVGLASAAVIGSWRQPRPAPSAAVEHATAAPAVSSTTEARLATIEAELEHARNERATLASELTALRRERAAAAPRPESAPQPAAEAPARRGGPRFGQDPPAGEASSGDALARRVAELTAGGFAPDRAQWIAEREAQLRMDALYSRYQAERSGEPPNPRQFFASEDPLRNELGDADYERYLAATGRPTDVPVGQVLTDSPAETAGLKAGDRIVAYGGQRVFDMRELNALTLKGSPGEPVAVDVIRDGSQVQLYLPRGPLGIYGSRRGR